jgi:tetratricopeptide (TPR) repeat protein
MTGEAAEMSIEHGYQARREHRLANAKRNSAEAVDRCREGANRAQLARALTGLGQIERDLHDLDAALTHYVEAVAIYRTADQPLTLAHTVRHVADILRNQARLDLAAPHYEEALEIYRGDALTPPLDLANPFEATRF